MERQSTQHSPRLDDEMERETRSMTQGAPIEARADEARMMEGPADGEPLPDAVVSMDDVELRSLLAASLRPSAFPGDRDRLMAVAEDEHADTLVLDLLHALPPDKVFPTPEAIWEELGGKVEVRDRPHPPPTPPPAPAPKPAASVATENVEADVDAQPAPLLVKGAAFAVSASVGAIALAAGVVREVCTRIRRLL